MQVVLSIAGSDSSGGAGIQADLKTMCAHGVYGMTAISALTVQNTMGVDSVELVSASFLEAQIDAGLFDIPADAVKIGMLSTVSQVEVVTKKMLEYGVENVVLDPVMVSTSGRELMDTHIVNRMTEILFPICRLITPNIPEAEKLSGIIITNESDMEKAASFLYEEYGCGVLIKGGHSYSKLGESNDLLNEHGKMNWLPGKRIDNPNTHGTGCTLSTAIACNLAKGYGLQDSVRKAKEYLTMAIAAGLDLGKGNGPLNHMVDLENR